LDLVLTGRWLDARAARRHGIVNSVVSPRRLRDEALRRAGALSHRRPELVAALKRAVNDGSDRSLAQGLEVEITRLGVR
jgi:enoyl-CoA hydratase/carnithine racemase